jgi:hypothetical protein
LALLFASFLVFLVTPVCGLKWGAVNCQYKASGQASTWSIVGFQDDAVTANPLPTNWVTNQPADYVWEPTVAEGKKATKLVLDSDMSMRDFPPLMLFPPPNPALTVSLTTRA